MKMGMQCGMKKIERETGLHSYQHMCSMIISIILCFQMLFDYPVWTEST